MSEPTVSIDVRRETDKLYPGNRNFDSKGVARVVQQMPSFAVMSADRIFEEPTTDGSQYVVDITSSRAEMTYVAIDHDSWIRRSKTFRYRDVYSRYKALRDCDFFRHPVEIHYEALHEGSRVVFHPYVYSIRFDDGFGSFQQEFLRASGLDTPIEKQLGQRTVFVPGPVWFRNSTAPIVQAHPATGFQLEMDGVIVFEDEVDILIDHNTPTP